jgi:heat shock protein HtpX
MSSRQSLTLRALMALGLMVGFYVLALAIVVGLLAALYAQVANSRFYPTLSIGAVLGIYAIISGVIPRRRKFVAPGPRLTPDDQPRLLEEIRTVADATGSAMPREVYLAPDVNAGVAHIGGFAGIGARPIMIVGLPLMAALTRSEFRGVIGHEFGHYTGGETRLAPVVYRTREAIFRTVNGLVAHGRRYLHLPFLWYGKMYLRITLSISRRQELAADAHAAAIAGGDSMETGLVKTAAAGLALRSFLNGEIGPVLNAGYRPPVVEGFVMFLHGGSMAPGLEQVTQQLLTSGRSDPYDSHPSLRERIDALRRTRRAAAPVPDPPAIELLDDVPGLEAALLSELTQRDVGGLPSVTWDEAAARVWIGIWEAGCREHGSALAEITVGRLPEVAADVASFFGRIQKTKAGQKRIDVFEGVIGAALTVMLARTGWSIHANPGDFITATRGDASIQTFGVLPDLMQRKMSPEEWQRTCAENGIAELDLSEAANTNDASTTPGAVSEGSIATNSEVEPA